MRCWGWRARGWRRVVRWWPAAPRCSAWDDREEARDDAMALKADREADRRSARHRPDRLRRGGRVARRPAQSAPDRGASARDAGVPVIGDIELFAQARASLPAHKVIGITGTNGKSTTTALIHHIVKIAGMPAAMGGNIGLPILGQRAAAGGRRLCARAVELPDRPDPKPRLRCRGAAEHHARSSRPL